MPVASAAALARGRAPRRAMQVLLVALFLCMPFVYLWAENLSFRTEALSVVRQDGSQASLTVELAVSGPERERGLMFRDRMADDHGMLFDFGTERLVTMWMKNTVLPLDMIFADKDGVIRTIRRNAVPFSEDVITSGEPVRFTLEIKAGMADTLRIAPGDRLVSPTVTAAPR